MQLTAMEKVLKANKQKFTMIELLCVLAVIVLLMSMLLPGLRSAKESAKGIACGGNLRQIGVGFYGYLADSGGVFPPSTWGNSSPWSGTRISWVALVGSYCGVNIKTVSSGWENVPSKSVFICPSLAYTGIQEYSCMTGYGYNTRCLGNMNYAPYSNFAYSHPVYPVRPEQIKKPDQNLMHVDACSTEAGGHDGRWIVEYVEKLRFRHNRKANTLYVDGHLKAEDEQYLYRGHEIGYPFNMVLQNKDWFPSGRGPWPYGYP